MILEFRESTISRIRLATAAGARGKPSVVISKNYDIFLGNEGNSAVDLSAAEIFGFNTGTFTEKIVQGCVSEIKHIQCFGRRP